MDHAESEITFLLFTGTLALLILSVGFTIIYARYVQNTAKQQRELLELEKKHKQELLQNILESVETERTRIARDLHDQIGNTFSVLSLILQHSEDEKVTEAKELISAGLHTTRELVYQIMPPELELLGLRYALEDICYRINKTDSLTAECTIQSDLSDYNSRIQLSLYRIVQELISNTIKHSNASRFTLSCHDLGTETQVIYQDNGTLKNERPPDHRKGYGLKNIESRVELLNGTFDYNFNNGFESRILIKRFYED